MKGKLKQTKGITLIALIITIIVLLILAVVSIRLVMNNGVLGKAEAATTAYGTAEEQEQIKLGYADYQMAQASGKSENLTVTGAVVTGNGPWAVEFSKTRNVYSVSTDGQSITPTDPSEKEWITVGTITSDKTNTILNATENTKLKDEYGNKIVVPAGFQIKVDEVDTNNATHVTEGIVVTDGSNEFVWIPVGKIYADVAKTEANAKTITLGRYLNPTVGVKTYQTIANYSEQVKINGPFTEDTSTNHDGRCKNAIAKDIYAFLSSAESNGGYYLGRYEARTTKERTAMGDELRTLTENKNDYVYNYVTQPQASSLSRGMYSNRPFTSDLINSYAWDTAIMFIASFSDNRRYTFNTSVNTTYSNTGTDSDKISNIYDMASNCKEFSTETYRDSSFPCTARGGYYYDNEFCTTDARYYNIGAGEAYKSTTFRPVLYV